nr:hypothetical protein CFP56_53974 [Quercus suber]
MHLPVIFVELDALLIVDMINGDSAVSKCLSPLVDDCRALLSRIPQHQVKHCYREANVVVDALARIGVVMEDDFVVFNSPPAYVLMLLYQDTSNFVYLRHCRSSANSLFPV